MLCVTNYVSVHRFSVPRSGLVFCLELAPMPENKGYRSEIRGFSSDFMDVRSKKSRALKFNYLSSGLVFKQLKY